MVKHWTSCGQGTRRAAQPSSPCFCSCEQAVVDFGGWDLAWLYMMEAEPPYQAMHRQPEWSALRVYPRAADQLWSVTCLQFLKELDTIQSRRAEMQGGRQPRPPGGPPAQHPASCAEPSRWSPSGPSRGSRSEAPAGPQEKVITPHNYAHCALRWIMKNEFTFQQVLQASYQQCRAHRIVLYRPPACSVAFPFQVERREWLLLSAPRSSLEAQKC